MSKSQIGKTASVVQGQSQGVLPRGGSQAVYQEAAQGGIHCVPRAKSLQSCPTLCDQAPLPMGFSRQEYWSGFLCPSPKELQDPGIERLPRWQAGCLPLAPPGKPRGSAH